MRKLKHAETKNTTSRAVLAFAISLSILFSIVIVTACASMNLKSSSDVELLEPTSFSASVSTVDSVSTLDQVTILAEPSICTSSEATTEITKETQFEDTEDYKLYGEQTYEVGEYDYESYDDSGDVYLLAKLIYLEAGDCSDYCQWLVGSTAMNLADENGGLYYVAYNYNMFNVAYMIDSCEPSSLSISTAERILSGDRDYVVRAFMKDQYHEWATPYICVDGVYFSTY